MKIFDNMTEDEKHIFALHKYYAHASQMHKYFEEELRKSSIHEKVIFLEGQIYMSLWYGMLYVVIEGWKELKLKDSIIDTLLKSENTELLRLYRNGMFHYQKNYNDDRFEKFYTEPTTVEWVQKVHCEFSRWFLKTLPK